MKKLLLFLLLLSNPCVAQMNSFFPGPGTVHTTGGGGYSGPCDISTPTAFWALRACGTAALGASLIDVFGGTTSTSFTFVSKSSDGTIELSAGGAAAFILANAGMVITKFYDQTGNGHHLTSSGGATPAFVATGSGLTSGAYVIFSSSTQFMSATGFAVAQPFYTSKVVLTSSTASAQSIMTDSSAYFDQINTSANYTMRAGASPVTVGAITTNSWFSLLSFYNGVSSVGSINGTTNSISPGISGITSGHVFQLGNDDFTENCSCRFLEGGIFSSTTLATMDANVRTFWGF